MRKQAPLGKAPAAQRPVGKREGRARSGKQQDPDFHVSTPAASPSVTHFPLLPRPPSPGADFRPLRRETEIPLRNMAELITRLALYSQLLCRLYRILWSCLGIQTAILTVSREENNNDLSSKHLGYFCFISSFFSSFIAM